MPHFSADLYVEDQLHRGRAENNLGNKEQNNQFNPCLTELTLNP